MQNPCRVDRDTPCPESCLVPHQPGASVHAACPSLVRPGVRSPSHGVATAATAATTAAARISTNRPARIRLRRRRSRGIMPQGRRRSGWGQIDVTGQPHALHHRREPRYRPRDRAARRARRRERRRSRRRPPSRTRSCRGRSTPRRREIEEAGGQRAAAASSTSATRSRSPARSSRPSRRSAASTSSSTTRARSA